MPPTSDPVDFLSSRCTQDEQEEIKGYAPAHPYPLVCIRILTE